MLEFDPIRTEGQFRETFETLLECGVSLRNLAQAIRYPKGRIARWSRGEDIPEPREWPTIVERLMPFVWKVVWRDDKKKLN